jgi:pre-mRNA-processing factor 19
MRRGGPTLVSGEVAQEPTLSPKSGHVFERRLIEKYISQNGKDPVSGDELAAEDLIAVKGTTAPRLVVLRAPSLTCGRGVLTLAVSKTVKPRAPTATSIPSLLTTFQNEWDAVALETFSLKQQLEQVRRCALCGRPHPRVQQAKASYFVCLCVSGNT